jgi:hypothetical protein
MNLLSQPQLLAALSDAGVLISHRLLGQSLHALMVADGFAQQVGVGRRAVWVYDGNRLDRWITYLQRRQAKIAAGVWHTKRPYSLEDLQALNYEKEKSR